MSDKEYISQQCGNQENIIEALSDPNDSIVLIMLLYTNVIWCFSVNELIEQWNIQTSEYKNELYPEGMMRLPFCNFIVDDSLIRGI